MRSFFKSFFASLLALIVFTLLVVFLIVAVAGSLGSKTKATVEANSVLILDLSQHFAEQGKEDPFSMISESSKDIPGLFQTIQLLNAAAKDPNISGLYIIANGNANSFSSSEELRMALLNFKKSGKFTIAHGDVITQGAYSVANAADKIYVSPQGILDWSGFSVTYLFLKGALDRLEIEPQIFYAGKFKSATEPLRTDHMTDANKLQTTVWLNDLYSEFLNNTAAVRKIDTATLHGYANNDVIRTSKDAVTYKLVDGAKYDDEVKDEIKQKLKIDKYQRINFITLSKYLSAHPLDRKTDGEKIALIYAEGDIVDGTGSNTDIGGDRFRSLIRKARLDRSVKAIVFRVNSGGGSSMASETIWRELALAKQEKPVVVSFGDVAASGGYYISCGADSIFGLPSCITGSIGVFGIIPNFKNFFQNKAGVTFDAVKTSPSSDAGSITRPLTDNEKLIFQANVELTYAQFKQRVADGRKRDTAYVDSIAQGRVWTGRRAKDIGLIDRFGGIETAIASAAKMAKLNSYYIKEYPESISFFDQILGKSDPTLYNKKLEEEIGVENFKIIQELRRVKEMTKSIQARIPFSYQIN